jgi:hypothetical protein
MRRVTTGICQVASEPQTKQNPVVSLLVSTETVGIIPIPEWQMTDDGSSVIRHIWLHLPIWGALGGQIRVAYTAVTVCSHTAQTENFARSCYSQMFFEFIRCQIVRNQSYRCSAFTTCTNCTAALCTLVLAHTHTTA